MTRRKSPAPPQRRALPNLTNSVSLPLNPAEDGYQPVDAADRRESELLAELAARGYRVAVKCRRCGTWCTAERSVSEHLGSYCRTVVDQ